MNNRYHLTLTLYRNIGLSSYYIQSLEHNYTYGKNGIFKTSTEGIKKIEKWIEPYKDEFSEICITIWNGGSGLSKQVSKTDKKFSHKIENFNYPIF